MGSTRLLLTLIEHDLVDEFRLMIDPLIVGIGKRIFPEDGVLSRRLTYATRVVVGRPRTPGPIRGI